MTLSLEELNDHISRIRADLEKKKISRDGLLFTDPSQGTAVSFQILCLEPRLEELEKQSRRLAKELEALNAA